MEIGIIYLKMILEEGIILFRKIFFLKWDGFGCDEILPLPDEQATGSDCRPCGSVNGARMS